MFNIKHSIIVAGIAFIISLLLGILSGASFPSLITRPLIFTFIFFVLSIIIPSLINQFLPELLEIQREPPDVALPGSNIDIKEDNAAVPDQLYARLDESSQDFENIKDISRAVSSAGSAGTAGNSTVESGGNGGLDQSGQNEYTKQGNGLAQESEGGISGLADLDSLSGAFIASSEDKAAVTQEEIESFSTSDSSARSSAGNKPQAIEGDFNPKELAAGIRTILNKKED